MKFGIDLGTTYSSIGWYNPETRQVEIADFRSAQGPQGAKLLPSAVFVESADNVVVGNTAINQGLLRGERLFRWFKRELGRAPQESDLVDGKYWTPRECSAEVLKAISREAGQFWNTEVKDVVITFPAFFSPQQKDLTYEAATEKAGLNVISMIEEPVAAAMAYLIDEILSRSAEPAREGEDLSVVVPRNIEQLAGRERGILVYDLGGGTFDVALVQAWGEPSPDGSIVLHTKVLCNEGHTTLGGKDFDVAIKEMLCELDKAQNDHDPREDPVAGKLDDDCETSKRDLSETTPVKMLCPRFHELELSRGDVAARTADLVDQTRQVIESVLARADDEFHLERDNITLLLSGGMCKWPPVTEMLTEVMGGRPPVVHRNTLDFMVTYGAAYLAHLTVVAEPMPVGGEEGLDQMPPSEITIPGSDTGLKVAPTEIPYPAIGVALIDETDREKKRMCIQRLIPTGATRGEYYEGSYVNAFDNQEMIRIKLHFLKEHEGFEDDNTDLSAWQEYKTFEMAIPPMPAGRVRIQAQLKYEEGGVISGRAWDDHGNEVAISGETKEG